MPETLVQRAFSGGELAPAFHARADLPRYLTGLRTCRNFLVRREGGVANRSGTKFVAQAKSGGGDVVLRPFVFAAADESYVLECGNQYFRFHKNGAPVTVSGVTAWSAATAYVVGDLASRLGVNYYCVQAHTNQQPPNATYWYAMPGTIYEIPTPYASGAFLAPAPACFTQSGNVITITHLNYAPRELRRVATGRFALTTVTTGPSIAAPGAPAGVAGAAGSRTFRYVVTAVKTEVYEESLPSAVIEVVAAADPTPDNPHALSWAAVAGAAEYHVYKDPQGNGTFGFIGVSTGVETFNDGGEEEPDFSQTPPQARVLFASDLNYPAVNVTYQQRRFFAGTHTNRELVWGSVVGFPSNFSIRSPIQDDDGVTFQIAGQRINPVHHMAELSQGLVLLTDGGEWLLHGDEQGSITPTAINPKQHGYVGASFAAPVVIGESVVFVQNRGRVLRDLRFDERIEGLSGRDLSIYSTHLFKRTKTVVEIAYAQVPDSIVWCVRSDGVLLGLTYIRDEDVWGWHRHDSTNGLFKSVCVIPEGDEDFVYVVVQREINGTTRRYIERFASRSFDAVEDAFFVDCGITYDGAAATVISGLSHLAGQVVNVLADGAVPAGFTFTVSSGGSITLPTAASTVQVGLPITAEIETLDLDVAGSNVRDKRKSIKSIALLLEESARGFSVGPSASQLFPQRREPWEATGLVTGQVEMTLTAGFTPAGRTLVRHTEPTPLTILSLMPNVEVGG